MDASLTIGCAQSANSDASPIRRANAYWPAFGFDARSDVALKLKRGQQSLVTQMISALSKSLET
jgi:hypothetical protein